MVNVLVQIYCEHFITHMSLIWIPLVSKFYNPLLGPSNYCCRRSSENYRMPPPLFRQSRTKKVIKPTQLRQDLLDKIALITEQTFAEKNGL